MEDVNDKLTSGQEAVCDEFACANGYWGVGLEKEVYQHMLAHLTVDNSIHPIPPLFRWLSPPR